MAIADWTNEDAYRGLEAVDASALAWEFLRRNEAYRAQWTAPGAAQRFGLAVPLDPALEADEAAPLWRAEAAPAAVVRMTAAETSLATLASLSGEAAIAHLAGGALHLRFRNGLQAVLPGGLARETPLAAITPVDEAFGARLAALRGLCAALDGRWPEQPVLSRARRRALVRRLRAHDGRRLGASYRQVCAAILGERFSESVAWRTSAARAAAIRLCATAQALVGGGYLRLLGGGSKPVATPRDQG